MPPAPIPSLHKEPHESLSLQLRGRERASENNGSRNRGRRHLLFQPASLPECLPILGLNVACVPYTAVVKRRRAVVSNWSHRVQVDGQVFLLLVRAKIWKRDVRGRRPYICSFPRRRDACSQPRHLPPPQTVFLCSSLPERKGTSSHAGRHL